VTRWPGCGEALLTELRHAPGRLALIVDDGDSPVGRAFAELQDGAVHHAGSSLSADPPETPTEVIDRLVVAGPVIVDLDLLFWKPWLALDPIGVFRAVSRRRPAILFQWPGTIAGAHATYSHPGRPDWFEAILSDAVVLRPASALFPDEPPYRIERFP
jgi:hypothetical protein